MANQIRIKTSVEVVNDNSVTNEGTAAGDYTHEALDAHTGSRSWGGSYNISVAYTDAHVCYWENAVIQAAGTQYVDNSSWTELSSTTAGGIPGIVYVVACEFTRSEGNATYVDIILSGEIVARLTEGESIVIPWAAGEAIGSVGISTPAYDRSAGDYATVNLMIAGTSA